MYRWTMDFDGILHFPLVLEGFEHFLMPQNLIEFVGILHFPLVFYKGWSISGNVEIGRILMNFGVPRYEKRKFSPPPRGRENFPGKFSKIFPRKFSPCEIIHPCSAKKGLLSGPQSSLRRPKTARLEQKLRQFVCSGAPRDDPTPEIAGFLRFPTATSSAVFSR